MKSSFEVKVAWISTGLVVLLFGFYVVQSASVPGPAATLSLLFRVVLAVATIIVAAHIVVAVARRPRSASPRDVLVAAKSGRNGGLVLGLAVLAAIGYSLIGGAIHTATQVCNPEVIATTAHVLVSGVLLSELTRSASQIVYHRTNSA